MTHLLQLPRVAITKKHKSWHLKLSELWWIVQELEVVPNMAPVETMPPALVLNKVGAPSSS